MEVAVVYGDNVERLALSAGPARCRYVQQTASGEYTRGRCKPREPFSTRSEDVEDAGLNKCCGVSLWGFAVPVIYGLISPCSTSRSLLPSDATRFSFSSTGPHQGRLQVLQKQFTVAELVAKRQDASLGLTNLVGQGGTSNTNRSVRGQEAAAPKLLAQTSKSQQTGRKKQGSWVVMVKLGGKKVLPVTP